MRLGRRSFWEGLNRQTLMSAVSILHRPLNTQSNHSAIKGAYRPTARPKLQTIFLILLAILR